MSKETASTDESESEEEDVIDIESEDGIKVTSEKETEMEPEEEFEIGSDDVTSEEETGFGDDFSGVNDGRIIIR